MEHFINIVMSQPIVNDEAIVESVLTSASSVLFEDATQYGIYELEDGNYSLTVELRNELTEDESDVAAETIAETLFELGYDNFDIEFSVSEKK